MADAPIRPPHAKLVKGRWFWDPPDRLRRSLGLKTIALGADTATAWARAAELNKHHLALTAKQHAPGTVAWLLDKFEASDKLESKAKATQRDYKWLARVLRDLELGPQRTLFGRYQVLAVKPRHADAIYGLLRKDRGEATAHYACRFARRVWHWAKRQEWAGQANPWEKMELRAVPPRRVRWLPDQVQAVVQAARDAGRPSIALAVLLAYWLGWRQADVLTLTWTELDAGLRITRKTGAELPIPWRSYPELAAALADTPRKAVQVLVNEHSQQPWTLSKFRHHYPAIAKAAGIPAGLQFRDLRATAGTEIADGDGSLIGIGTHLGHQTAQMARRYARPTMKQADAAARARLSVRTEGEQPGKPPGKQGNHSG